MFCRTVLLKEVLCRAKHNLVNSLPFITLEGDKTKAPAKSEEEKEAETRAASQKVWELPIRGELNAFLPFCHKDTDRRLLPLTRHQLYLKSLEVLSQPQNILVANT